jgi:hypothetical protein
MEEIANKLKLWGIAREVVERYIVILHTASCRHSVGLSCGGVDGMHFGETAQISEGRSNDFGRNRPVTC